MGEVASDWSELVPLIPDTVLAALGPHLHGELEARAVQGVLQIEDRRNREAALVALVPRLSADALESVVPSLRGIDDDYSRRGIALQVCPSSEVTMLERILQPDLARAEGRGALGHLAELAPSVPGPLRERAFALAERCDDDYGRAALVRARASVLEDGAQERLVGVARGISREALRVDTLKVLVPHLGQDLLDRVWEAAEAMDTPARARLLGALAPRLTGARRRYACEEALAVARPLDRFIHARERADLLVSIAPAIDPAVVEELLGESWVSEARAHHRDVLIALAPRLSADQLHRVLELVRHWRPNDTALVLVGLAPHLSDRLLEEAVALAPHQMWGVGRARALAALAPRFRSRARTLSLLGEALDALSKPLYGSTSLDAVKALAGCLPDELWQRGLDAAQAVAEPGYRACALAYFLPTAPDPRDVRRLVRLAIADHIYEELSARSRPDLALPHNGLRCEALASPWLDPTTLGAMASAVLDIDDEWSWP
jgi:hypothetical protein